MSFRRVPFQFTATDPAARQRELRKRFGLPVSEEMYVDLPNSSGMGVGARESNSASSSPRLQHRVPIFVEGSEPAKSSVDSNNAESVKKPRVRVIPIEVEGAGSPTIRQRTYSGPAGIANERNLYDPLHHEEPISPVKRSMQDLSMSSKIKSPTGPRVCNIPIQIEGRGNKDCSANKVPRSTSFNKATSVGCDVTKTNIQSDAPNIQKSEPDISIPVKKIDSIVSELKSYEEAVENFTGTVKDKQYRFLDEMLTRCMLKLDDIDTMGNETVRMVRKAAVKKVQNCIDLLESKVNAVVDNNDVASKLVYTNMDNDVAKGNQNVCEPLDASEVLDVSMEEAKTELKEDNGETTSNEEKNSLQIETNDVGMTECMASIDQEMESTNQTMKNEVTPREFEISSDIQMESETVTDAKEFLSDPSENSVHNALKVSSDEHMESDIEMTDKEVTDKTGVQSSTSKNANESQQKEISDVDMPDETLLQKQDKTNNVTVECLPNEASNFSGVTPVCNGIQLELQNKMGVGIHCTESEVCDSIKHPAPVPQYDNNELNVSDTK